MYVHFVCGRIEHRTVLMGVDCWGCPHQHEKHDWWKTVWSTGHNRCTLQDSQDEIISVYHLQNACVHFSLCLSTLFWRQRRPSSLLKKCLFKTPQWQDPCNMLCINFSLLLCQVSFMGMVGWCATCSCITVCPHERNIRCILIHDQPFQNLLFFFWLFVDDGVLVW